MFLSEYQAKEILHQYGVPVPQGRIASSSRTSSRTRRRNRHRPR